MDAGLGTGAAAPITPLVVSLSSLASAFHLGMLPESLFGAALIFLSVKFMQIQYELVYVKENNKFPFC